MKAEMKVSATLNSKDKPLLIAKIRTEHELIFSPDSLATVEAVINSLGDDSELVQHDDAHFAWELRQLLEIYRQYQLQERPPLTATGRLESEWQPITGYFSIDTLKRLHDSMPNVNSMRIDGTPQTGLKLVLQSGINIIEIPADRPHLNLIRNEVEAAKRDLLVIRDEEEAANRASANVALALEVVIAVGVLIEVGLGIWDRWDKEQEKKRQKEEAERRKQEEERHDFERRCGKPVETSEGGPAARDLRDTISRMC